MTVVKIDRGSDDMVKIRYLQFKLVWFLSEVNRQASTLTDVLHGQK